MGLDTPEQITIHFSLLIEEGYIKALDTGSFNDEVYILDRLTFDGYQYLEAIKSDTIWNKYQEVAKDIGMQAVKFILPILADIIRKQLTG